MGATAVIAGAAVASAATGIASAAGAFGGSSAPNPGPAPTPANSYAYGADGELSEQVWSPSQNAYITRTDVQPTPDMYSSDADYQTALSAWQQRQTDNANQTTQIAAIKNQMLSNLNQTPADRIAAYQQYADTISSTMHQSVDPTYTNDVNASRESMQARGMTGSAAQVATEAELAKEKGNVDTQIAQAAESGKENLANTDQANWRADLSAADQGTYYADIQNSMDTQEATATANQGEAANLAAYYANSNNYLQSWQNSLAQRGALTSAAGSLAGGLGMAALYNNARSPVTPGYTNSYTNAMNFDTTVPSYNYSLNPSSLYSTGYGGSF